MPHVDPSERRTCENSRKARLKAQKLCIECKAPTTGTHIMCENHLSKTRERNKARAIKRKNSGLCTDCGLLAVSGKSCCVSCLEQHAAKAKITRLKLKLDILNVYSNGDMRCACCGETMIEFLGVDHLNDDGAQHRAELGGSRPVYLWLKKNNYPAGYQVLCHNCNLGRHINGGICPHKANTK